MPMKSLERNGSPSTQSAGTRPVVKGGLTPENYAFLQTYIHDESGIVIDSDKQYLLESRLLPVAVEQEFESLNALVMQLASRRSSALGRLVVEAMTTHETLFFRDPLMFESLARHVLPGMFAQIRGNRKLRVWSAAASTGQEAYSMAITLLSMGKGKEDVEIVATDLSQAVLDRAKEGRYNKFEMSRGLNATQLKAYFRPVGTDWQLTEDVRDMVHFEQLDLRRNFYFLGSFDIVFCRNVLIYFDTETKRQIVTTLHHLLSPEAILVLGCAETIINIHDGFQRRLVGQSTFYSVVTPP